VKYKMEKETNRKGNVIDGSKTSRVINND